MSTEVTSPAVIVAGGGIGGLAAAVGLHRVGCRVTVLERASAFRPVGAGLTLAPNAVRALDALGLGEQLRARGMAQGAAGLRTWTGRWLMRTRVEELEQRFGVPTFALHRADLHDMLIGSLSGGDVRTGHTVTGLDGGRVLYDGPGGPGELSADLVVAADGIRSRLRNLVFPGHPAPEYAGYITWRGVVPADRVPDALPESLTESWGRGQRFGIIPLADGRVYWYATQSLPPGQGARVPLAEVAARYHGWHDPIPQLLAATPPQALLGSDIYSLKAPLPAYVRGSAVLLGDAAHALTPDLGQGAAQALEDAATLAAVVADAPNLNTALAAYDSLRRPRTQRLVEVSARFGRIAQQNNPLTAALRDMAAALIPSRTYVNETAGTLSWRPPGG